MTEQDFLAWEAKSKDTIDFKTIYVDIAGDIVAGLYLSQCVFWHLPNIHGETKLRIERDGKLWIARADAEWYSEIRLTAKQARRARETLCEKRIMESRIFKFDGTPKCHVRVIMPKLMAEINRIILDQIDLPHRASGKAPQGKPSSPMGHSSFTEITTETTSKNIKSGKPRDEIAYSDFAHFCSIWLEKTGQDYTKENPGLYFAARKKYSQEKVVRAMINYANDEWRKKNKAWRLAKFLKDEIFQWLPSEDTILTKSDNLLENLPEALQPWADHLEQAGRFEETWYCHPLSNLTASFVEEQFAKHGIKLKIIKKAEKVGV